MDRSALSSSQQIGIAVAGLNGRGQSLVKAFASIPGCAVLHLIDPDGRTIPSQLEYLKQNGFPKPRVSVDVREALLDPNVAALAIATPNHWHALMTLWACEARRDVFVEKPCSHTLHEGILQVQAAKITKRNVHVGTQRRSMGCYRAAIRFIESGQAGQVLSAHAYCYRRRTSIGFQPVEHPPKELDFDMWLGPAPVTPYHRNLTNGNWHWFPEFGDGECGAQGIHQLDVARWGLGNPTHPKRVVTIGGRFSFFDQGYTANTLLAYLDYGRTGITFEVRGLPTEPFPGWIPSFANLGRMVGNAFYLEDGVLVDNVFFKRDGTIDYIPSDDVASDSVSGTGTFVNFVKVVRGEAAADCDIQQGHLSASLIHLIQISLKRGTDIGLADFLRSDMPEGLEQAGERFKKHLIEANLDPNREFVRIGRELHFIPEEERFANDLESDVLLGNTPRSGFEFPNFV